MGVPTGWLWVMRHVGIELGARAVFEAHGLAYRLACPHQVCDESGALHLGQFRIGHAPELAVHHEIPLIRRDGLGHG